MAKVPKATVELFQAPAMITKIETQRDGGYRIIYDTQELTNEDMVAKLFRLKKFGVGWLLFKSKQIELEDIPEYDPVQFEEEKTPSKRLRSVLFLYWNNVLGKKGQFDSFYRSWMENKIEEVKSTLPPQY